ncbi:MAG: hypothetical protein IPM48_09210 [Saprospiraceae bacterium]|nr:hypothetical protein [Saprospiraceae bacterium]
MNICLFNINSVNNLPLGHTFNSNAPNLTYEVSFRILEEGLIVIVVDLFYIDNNAIGSFTTSTTCFFSGIQVSMLNDNLIRQIITRFGNNILQNIRDSINLPLRVDEAMGEAIDDQQLLRIASNAFFEQRDPIHDLLQPICRDL